MAITDLEIATRVRNLVTEQSGTNLTIPHIQALIPTAMEMWVEMMKKHSEAKALLTKARSIPLVAGSLDLTPYIDGTTAKMLLDDIPKTTLYTTIGSVRTPLTWVASQAQLNSARYFTTEDPAVWLDNRTLRTRNTDGSQTTLGAATIDFDVVEIPTAATLPASLLGSFVSFLAEYAVKEKAVDGG